MGFRLVLELGLGLCKGWLGIGLKKFDLGLGVEVGLAQLGLELGLGRGRCSGVVVGLR